MLIPLAAHGLSPNAMGRRYARSDHPRLDSICNSNEPVRFPADSTLPDPFDGLLAKDADALHHIHACLGCPLYVDENLVGALTADALDPQAFDHLDQGFLKAIGAIAGAQMQTANLIEAIGTQCRASRADCQRLDAGYSQTPGKPNNWQQPT